MIVLPTTTKLQVVLGDAAATEMDFVASYIDTTADVVGQNNGVTNDTTDVDMVAAPAADQRLIRYVSIYNADSATHSVTVKTDASATERILVKQSLAAGQTLIYDSQAGWYLAFDGASAAVTRPIIISCSDETTDLTVADGKVTFRMPYAFTLTEVRASVTTAPTGAGITVDIEEGGATILSTLLTIDATEKTSTTAATPAVIDDASLADDAEMTINVDVIGSTIAGAGLKVTLIGYQTA